MSTGTTRTRSTGGSRPRKSGLLGGRIKWNFTKFLVGRDGQVIERFAPTTTPADLEKDVVAALAAPRP
jgi:glutathione peroxidase